MNHKKRIVIIGATSLIAEHCARYWVTKEAVDLTLVGRDKDKINRVARDLNIRSPESAIHEIIMDFFNPRIIQNTVENILEKGTVDIALIAQGFLPVQNQCQEDLTHCADVLTINGISPVLFAEAFVSSMEKANRGTLAVIGSVAGDRARKANYVYGAAKGLVERYMQGLQHRLSTTKVSVILVKPGPTDTPMTCVYKERGMKLASVESVAKTMVTAIERGKKVVYVLRKWHFIMGVVKRLPDFVFHKISV